LADFLDSSPLKTFGQMNRNLVGSICGKSSVAIAHFVPTRKFRIIWPSGFRGEDFWKSTNQKQELLVVAMFVNGSG
jgi:hypothetical protein